MAKYLMQHPSGYIYMWTELQAKRKDMIEINEEEAKKRLPAQAKGKPVKASGQELKIIAAEAPEPVSVKPATGLKEMPEVVDMPPTDEAPQDVVQPISDDTDPDIKMLEEIRIVGKGKAKIELYMLEKYGIDVDRRLKLDVLIDQAVAAREKELSSNTGDLANNIA